MGWVVQREEGKGSRKRGWRGREGERGARRKARGAGGGAAGSLFGLEARGSEVRPRRGDDAGGESREGFRGSLWLLWRSCASLAGRREEMAGCRERFEGSSGLREEGRRKSRREEEEAFGARAPVRPRQPCTRLVAPARRSRGKRALGRHGAMTWEARGPRLPRSRPHPLLLTSSSPVRKLQQTDSSYRPSAPQLPLAVYGCHLALPGS